MNRIVIAAVICIATASSAFAQSSVQVVGPVTPGDCVKFASVTILQDAGVTCGGGGGGGAVNSVSNADSTLTVFPTTGSVVASLNLGNPNTWTGAQTFGTATVTSALNVSGTENVTGTFQIAGNPFSTNSALAISSASTGQLAYWSSATAIGGENISSALTAGNGISLTGTTNAKLSAVLPTFIGGLTLSNDSTTPNSVLDIAAGQATDSTNAVNISIGAFTKTTGGAWASGSGNAGMGNGLSIAASTWYHVCLANNNGTADIWFDTSAVCANRPGGISDTKYRRIGSFKTDGSSHILAFVQIFNEFLWAVPVQDASNTSVPTAATLKVLTGVPSGVKVRARIRVLYASGSSSGSYGFLIQSPDETSAVANVIAGNDTLFTAVTSNYVGTDLSVRTDISAQVRWSSTLTGSVAYLVTYGWVDYLGQ